MSVNYTFKAFESNDTIDDDVGVAFPRSKYTKVLATFDDMASWPKVLKQFVQFLGSVYGYDIIKDIKVKDTQLDQFE